MKKNDRMYEAPDGELYPIRESTKNGMILLTTAEDVAKADRHDPHTCVLAQCAIRSGAKEAFIAGTVAYIVMPFEGEMSAVKFQVPVRTRAAIISFDETGEMPSSGFELAPLRPSYTSSVKRVENARRKTRTKHKAPRPAAGIRHDLRTYRHLSGHVHTQGNE